MRYSVGTRNGQISHIHGGGVTPLINVVDQTNVIVGGFHDEALAARVVGLLNARDAQVSGYTRADVRQLREFARVEVTGGSSMTPNLSINPFGARRLIELLDAAYPNLATVK